MTRDEFTTGCAQRLRHVLQAAEREAVARARVQRADKGELSVWDAHCARRGLANTNVVLDAAITELFDFVFDAFESKAPLEPCA